MVNRRGTAGRLVLSAAVVVGLSAAWGWVRGQALPPASPQPKPGRGHRAPRPQRPPREDVVTRQVQQDLVAKRATLGLDDRHGFALKSTFAGDGARFHRYRQLYKGLPMLAGSVIVETSPTGAVTRTHDHLQRKVEVDVVPRISQAVVEAKVRRDLGVPDSVPTRAELAIQTDRMRVVKATGRPPGPGDGALNLDETERRVVGHRLVWRVQVAPADRRAGARPFEYLVDARTGEIVRKHAQFAGVSGDGKSQFSGTVSLEVSHGGDCGHKFQMIDPTRSGNTIMIDDIDTIFEDQDNHWGDGKAPDLAHPFDPSDADDCPARFFEPRGQTAAVDALHGLNVALDMYLHVFHLRGWDGDGDEVDVVVHSPDQTGYFYGFLQDPYIIVADDVVTDDKTNKITAIIPEASVDIIGHEFTHGVDQHLADIPDLLTEGTADIFGVAARRYWNDGSKAHGFLAHSTFIPSSDDFNDFTIGHQFATGDRSRLFRPSLLFSDKNHLSGLDEVGPDIDDIPDPHKSGMPLTRAFFFLSQGASAHVDWETQPDAHHTFASYTDRLLWGMPGLGIDRAAHIFFRAMFECAPDEYGEARACAKVSATHPDALEAVENAFAGINVGAKASSYPPPPVEHKESEHNDDRDHADHVTPSNPPAAPFEQVAKAHITGTFSSRQDEDWTQVDAKCGTKMGLAWDGQSAGEMELALFEKGNTHQLGDRRLKHKQIAFDPKTDAHATHSRTCAKHDTITYFVKATATGPVKTDKRYSWRIDLY